MFSDTDPGLPYGQPEQESSKRYIGDSGKMGNWVNKEMRIFWGIQENTKVRIIKIFTKY